MRQAESTTFTPRLKDPASISQKTSSMRRGAGSSQRKKRLSLFRDSLADLAAPGPNKRAKELVSAIWVFRLCSILQTGPKCTKSHNKVSQTTPNTKNLKPPLTPRPDQPVKPQTGSQRRKMRGRGCPWATHEGVSRRPSRTTRSLGGASHHSRLEGNDRLT